MSDDKKELELSGKGEPTPFIEFDEDLPYWGCEPKEDKPKMQLSINQADVAACREEAEKLGPDTIVSDGNYTISPLSNNLEPKEK